MSNKKTEKAEVIKLERDESGFGNLAGFESFSVPEEGFAPGAVFNNHEIAVITLIDDNSELASAYLTGDMDAVPSWVPTLPDGKEWFLAVVSENDEGVYAVAAKPGVHGVLTGKAFAQEFLLGSLIKATTKHLKTMSKPFTDMKEAEQKRVMDAVFADCREAVKDAIDIIASNGRLTFTAAVDQVVFKDGVKAVLSLAKGDWAHSLADAEGGYVTIVIEERSKLLQEGDSLEIDPDQKNLLEAA